MFRKRRNYEDFLTPQIYEEDLRSFESLNAKPTNEHEGDGETYRSKKSYLPKMGGEGKGRRKEGKGHRVKTKEKNAPCRGEKVKEDEERKARRGEGRGTKNIEELVSPGK